MMLRHVAASSARHLRSGSSILQDFTQCVRHCIDITSGNKSSRELISNEFLAAINSGGHNRQSRGLSLQDHVG